MYAAQLGTQLKFQSMPTNTPNDWEKVQKRTGFKVTDDTGDRGEVSTETTLDNAVTQIKNNPGRLTKYSNGEGALTDRNKNDVTLPRTARGGQFYEFDMVDIKGNQIQVTRNGRVGRHEFRLVIEVDRDDEPQVAWVSTAHYGVGENQAKKGWKAVRGFGPHVK